MIVLSLILRRRDLVKTLSTPWFQPLTKAANSVTTTIKSRAVTQIHKSDLPFKKELQTVQWKLSWPCSRKIASRTSPRSISNKRKIATSYLNKKTPRSISRIRTQRITLPPRQSSHKTILQLMNKTKITQVRSISIPNKLHNIHSIASGKREAQTANILTNNVGRAAQTKSTSSASILAASHSLQILRWLRLLLEATAEAVVLR